jgi:tetratricopeptide (TPR) repeat protein
MDRLCTVRLTLLTFLRVVPYLLACSLLTPAMAQVLGNPIDYQGTMSDQMKLAKSFSTGPNTGILVFKVFAERKSAYIDRQALLKLVNLSTQTPMWQTTEEAMGGEPPFGVFTDVPYGSYDVEISAVGYLSAHQQLRVASTQVRQDFEIVLQRDPSALNLDVGNSILSPKARKETKAAIAALKSARLDDAQKHLNLAYKLTPSDPNLNFLLGYLYFEKKDFAQAATYLSASTSFNPHNAQALTLLGRAGLEKKDYPAARSALEQAVFADPDNWLPHDLLADTYFKEKTYDKARDEARTAISKGKDLAGPAQLVLGQALVNLGQDKEGIEALNKFLDQSPRHPVAGKVRELIAQLQEYDSASSSREAAPTKVAGVDPLLAVPATNLSVKAWQPPGVDDVKLSLAPGVTCPTDKVIDQSGLRVQEMVEDVTKFAAVEDLFHQALDEYGTPVRTETRKFNYVASISESRPGFLDVEEYRADKLGLAGYPDQIASTGFAALALVFHPHMRDNFEMTCEGLGDWRGQASWLIHFRQRDDRPNRMHSYKVGNTYHAVKLKGRAWITADKFQIVRIEAEMVKPMPEIQLLSEHQVVEYGPIPFEKKNITLWLPKSAEIYFDFRKHRYYRRHTFDHYMLFSTDTEEKTKESKGKLAEKKS